MIMTDHVSAMIQSHPQSIQQPKQEAMVNAIQACFDCSQNCVTCADACLGEEQPQIYRNTIRITQDCSDICDTTARVLSRLNAPDFKVIQAQVASCIAAIKSCIEACNEHAKHHEHCRICAESCRYCEGALLDYQEFLVG